MWMLAWTINSGGNDLVDHWTVHETLKEAEGALAGIADDPHLHCWAIAPITAASEYHWEMPKNG